jgi:hypothetical protein
MKKTLLSILLIFLVCPIVLAQQNIEGYLVSEFKGDWLHTPLRILSGTWDCTGTTCSCIADCPGVTELSDGDYVALDTGLATRPWKSYKVNGAPAAANTFQRLDQRSTAPYAAVSGSALYHCGKGADGTLRVIYDGNGVATALLIATDQVGVAYDGGNAATELIEITNTYEPSAGETGSTAELVFSLFGSDDDGSTYAKHAAAKWKVIKTADWVSSGEGDFSSDFEAWQTIGGTEYKVFQSSGGSLIADFGVGVYTSGVLTSYMEGFSTPYGVWVGKDGAFGISDSTAASGTKEFYISKFKDGSGNVYGQINDATGSTSSGTGTGRWLTGVGSASDPAFVLGAETNGYGFWLDTNIFTFTVQIATPARTTCKTIAPSSVGLGATSPTWATIGTYRALQFDAIGELGYFSFEVPGDWNGTSDMTLKIYVFTESDNIIADTEVIEFDATYRAINVEGNEAYDSGTTVTISPTYTQSGAGTDKQGAELTATIDYDDANQPLTVDYLVGFVINRDVGASDTYSGAIYLDQLEACWQSTSIPDHF